MTSDWNTGADLTVADKTYRYASLARLQEAVPGAVIERLPFVTRVLLENLYVMWMELRMLPNVLRLLQGVKTSATSSSFLPGC